MTGSSSPPAPRPAPWRRSGPTRSPRSGGIQGHAARCHELAHASLCAWRRAARRRWRGARYYHPRHSRNAVLRPLRPRASRRPGRLPLLLGRLSSSRLSGTERGPMSRPTNRLIRSPSARTPDQPNRPSTPRVPVTRRIVAELDRADNRPLVVGYRPGPLTGFAEGRTYIELAQAVYECPEPTVAQVKAVQRAAKRLVDAGRIERGGRSGEVVVLVLEDGGRLPMPR